MATELAQKVRAHRAEILSLATSYGVHNVRIFGSVVRGESDAESDVDFLVDLQPSSGLLQLGGLLMDLRDLLGVSVDIVTPELIKPRLRDRICKEARPL